MARSTPAIKFTYADYRNTPNDKRYELLDGDLVMTPAPGTAHQRVLRKLTIQLGLSVERTNVGEVFVAPFDVVLSDTDVVQPDLLFVSNERSHIITDENIQGAPDLVVEILSPSTAERDRTYKRALYAKYGVGEYWLVDTDAKSVTVLFQSDHGFTPAGTYGEGHVLISPTLRNFTLDPVEIF